MEYLLQNATFRLFPDANATILALGGDGDVFHSRRIKCEHEGKDTLKTAKGDVRYTYFTWDDQPNKFLPKDEWMVPVHYQFEECGNIQNRDDNASQNLKSLAASVGGEWTWRPCKTPVGGGR